MPDTLKDYNSYSEKMNNKLSPTKTEVMEVLSIATLVGGAVVFSNISWAYEFRNLLEFS